MIASDVPEKLAPDGTETVIIVDGPEDARVFKRSSLGTIVAAALATTSAAAIAAINAVKDAATDTVNAAIAAAQLVLDGKVAAAAGSVVTSAANAAASDASRILADGSAANAAVSASLALGAGGVLGPETNYANLIAHQGTYAIGNLVRVTADETHGNQTSIYKKTAAIAPYFDYQNGGQVTAQPDKLGRYRLPARMQQTRTRGTKLLKKLHQCALGLALTVNGIVHGDSLATTTWASFNVQLCGQIEPWLGGPQVYWDSIGIAPTSSISGFTNFAATSAAPYPAATTGTILTKTNYANAWDGSGAQLANGQYTTFGVSGNNCVVCDEAIAFIDMETGAGAALIEVGEGASTVTGVAFRNPTAGEIIEGGALTGGQLIVNLESATLDRAVVRLRFSSIAARTLKITQVGGAGKSCVVIPMMGAIYTAPAINIYRMASASNSFVNVLATATPRMIKLWNALNLDFSVIESDDNIVAYQTLMPQLIATREGTNYTHKPDVFLPTNPYYFLNGAPYDEFIWQRGEYVSDAIAGLYGYDAPDLMAWGGGALESINQFVLDQIHYNGLYSYMACRNYCLQAGYVRHFPMAPGAVMPPLDAWNLASGRGLDRVVKASEVGMMVARPRKDMSSMPWVGDAVGTGTLDTTNRPPDFKLSSAAGAATHKTAYVAQVASGGFSAGGSLMGGRLGALDGSQFRGVASVIMPQNFGVDGDQFFFGCFMGNHSDGFAATLPAGVPTGEHIGIEVYWSAGALWARGTTWTTARQVTTAVPVRQNPNAFTIDIGWRARPGVTSTIQGFLDFFIGDTQFAEVPFRHTQTLCAPKAFIRNNPTTGGIISMWVQPPIITLPARK